MTLGKTVPELDTEADVVGTDLFATYRSPGPLKKVTALTTRTYMSALSAAKAANLSDLADIPTARANLDLVVPPLLMAGVLSALGNSPYWIKVREPDAVLFVLLANDFSLQSYSLADPANPVLLDAVAVGTSGAGPAYLALDGAGNVYVTDQNTNTLRVVDASDPADMSVIATLVYDASGGGGGGRCDVSPNGDYLCIGGLETGANANRAYVVDISTPASPVVTGSTAAIGSTHRGTAWVSNTVFAVASRDDKTLMLVDATTPSAPVLVGSYVTPSGLGSVTTPVTWDAGSATLFVGNFLGGTLLALDVSTPATPVLKDSVAIPNNAEQIAITDTGRALVACRNNNTLALVDCEDPSDMSLVASYVLPGTTTPGVGYYDGFTYVTCAGDTTNGKVFVLAVEPTLEEAIEALQAATTSVSASSATKAGNTFSGTQTITPVAALALTSNTASISFGTTSPDTLSRTADASFSWPSVSLALGNVISYSSGAMLRAKASPATSFWAVDFDALGDLRLGAGTTATDVRVGRRAANVWGGISTHISCATAGFGLRVAEGSNAKQGTAVLIAGVVTVANTSVTANSRIFLQRQTDGGTVGASYSITRAAGTSFTITAKDGAGADQAADTSTLAYEIFEPA